MELKYKGIVKKSNNKLEKILMNLPILIFSKKEILIFLNLKYTDEKKRNVILRNTKNRDRWIFKSLDI